jgi:hypothetical protein
MALSDSLVHYWKLDESSDGSGAVTRNDSVGTAHFTDNNTTPSATGLISNGCNFTDTSSESLSTTHLSDLDYTGAENISFSLWFKADSVTGVNTIFSKWANPVGKPQNYILYTNGSTLTFGSLQDGAILTKASIATATWYHVVVTMSSSKNFAMIVNDGTPATGSSVGTPGGTGSSSVCVATNTTTNYYDGIVDEIGFWNKILSAAEITSLYNGGAGLAYPFPSTSHLLLLLGIGQ